jgi:multidrug efflux pump subunit AcrA (membrane-fusion protein)
MRAISNPNHDLTRRQQKSPRVWIIPFLLSLFAFENIGCSSAKPPNGILSQAELDVRAASEARADELAPMDLQSARDKLEASRQAMAAKKYDDARRLAETAQVEAELATAKAEAEITRRTADDLRRRLDPLRPESERGAGLQPSPASKE